MALFQLIKKVVSEHKSPDIPTIGALIQREDRATMGAMLESSKYGFSPTMFGQYEAQCLDLRKRRMIKTACEKTLRQLEDPSEQTETLADDLQKVINDNGPKMESVAMKEAAITFYEQLENKTEIVYTGISGFDRLTGGLQPGMLIILGARPGVGKSALAAHIAAHIAAKSGPVLMDSREMTEQEIVARMMASATGVSLSRYVTKTLTEEDWRDTAKGLSELGALPIRFTQVARPLQLRREASAMQRQGGLKLIVVDYLQLMRASEKTGSRYEEVSSISRDLKEMAMELQVPILALTQFNRASENGNVSREPSMSEARESGAIEQDANIFLILHRPEEPKVGSQDHDFWKSCTDRGVAFYTLRVAKNRQGATGRIPLEFDQDHMRFMTLARG